MDIGFIFIASQAVLGAASIAGGIVAYRRSDRTGIRALGAAAIAAGIVMWVILLLTTPVSVTSGEGPPAPVDTSQSHPGRLPPGDRAGT